MPNAYNTPAYRAYIADYATGFPLVEEETEFLILHGLAVTCTTRLYEREGSHCMESRTTGRLTIRDAAGIEHHFDTVDHVMPPVALTLGECRLILFRRTLYGYTLLDANDIAHPLLDYFPSDVLGGEEMFIFCNAYPMGDLIVLEGCYWAISYGRVFILDPTTGRVLDLNRTADILDVSEQSISTTDDMLILRGRNAEFDDDLDHEVEGVLYTFTLSDLHTLLNTYGQFDL